MTFDEILDKYIRKLGRNITAGEVVYDLRHLEQPVRCKECKHRDSDECPHGMMYHPDDMGYCAWGERREDGRSQL